MFRLIRLFHTSIGSKLMMATSGLVLVVFLTGHLLGNMKVFQGPEALNEYAAWLQGHPLLWVIRLTMLSIFLLHVVNGVRLAIENRAARPQRYLHPATVQTNFAARHMMFSGVLVLSFLVYHLLHLTLGAVEPQFAQLLDAKGRVDVYARVVLGFSDPWITGSYLVALVLLGLHLQHAIGSLVQTLGFNHESYQRLICNLVWLLVVSLVVGFASIPLSVWFGWVTISGGIQP